MYFRAGMWLSRIIPRLEHDEDVKAMYKAFSPTDEIML